MKKWLVVIGVIVLALAGATVWLAGEASKARPPEGEVRLEVENVF